MTVELTATETRSQDLEIEGAWATWGFQTQGTGQSVFWAYDPETLITPVGGSGHLVDRSGDWLFYASVGSFYPTPADYPPRPDSLGYIDTAAYRTRAVDYLPGLRYPNSTTGDQFDVSRIGTDRVPDREGQIGLRTYAPAIAVGPGEIFANVRHEFTLTHDPDDWPFSHQVSTFVFFHDWGVWDITIPTGVSGGFNGPQTTYRNSDPGPNTFLATIQSLPISSFTDYNFSIQGEEPYAGEGFFLFVPFFANPFTTSLPAHGLNSSPWRKQISKIKIRRLYDVTSTVDLTNGVQRISEDVRYDKTSAG